jgi:hypothetical protein
LSARTAIGLPPMPRSSRHPLPLLPMPRSSSRLLPQPQMWCPLPPLWARRPRLAPHSTSSSCLPTRTVPVPPPVLSPSALAGHLALAGSAPHAPCMTSSSAQGEGNLAMGPRIWRRSWRELVFSAPSCVSGSSQLKELGMEQLMERYQTHPVYFYCIFPSKLWNRSRTLKQKDVQIEDLQLGSSIIFPWM